jgi:hypothetical protein
MQQRKDAEITMASFKEDCSTESHRLFSRLKKWKPINVPIDLNV